MRIRKNPGAAAFFSDVSNVYVPNTKLLPSSQEGIFRFLRCCFVVSNLMQQVTTIPQGGIECPDPNYAAYPTQTLCIASVQCGCVVCGPLEVYYRSVAVTLAITHPMLAQYSGTYTYPLELPQWQQQPFNVTSLNDTACQATEGNTQLRWQLIGDYTAAGRYWGYQHPGVVNYTLDVGQESPFNPWPSCENLGTRKIFASRQSIFVPPLNPVPPNDVVGTATAVLLT